MPKVIYWVLEEPETIEPSLYHSYKVEGEHVEHIPQEIVSQFDFIVQLYDDNFGIKGNTIQAIVPVYEEPVPFEFK